MEKIQVSGLSFEYRQGAQVLDQISFTVQAGECVGIVGESGCGKSTLCHILSGIIPNAISGRLSGDVRYDGISILGKTLAEISESAGFVMQDPMRQIVTTAVEDELAFGPENKNVPPKEIAGRVEQGLELFGLKEQRLEDPARLSGGQIQLTAMASVWTMKTDILILDEPFSHLDPKGAEAVEQVIETLLREGAAILISEHDFRFLRNTDRVLWIQNGRIREEGNIQAVQRAYESYFG